MSMSDDLELLREIFKDHRLHLGIGTVSKIGVAKDGSKLRVQVNILPDQRPVICEMTFADVMDVTFPELEDLVIIGNIDGSDDETFVLKVVNNKDEPIPKLAQDGHTVKGSRKGKKLYLNSDTKIGIGKPDVDQTENLVLGKVFQDFMSKTLQKIEDLETQLASLAATLSTHATTLSSHSTQLATQAGSIAAYGTALATHTHDNTTPGPSGSFSGPSSGASAAGATLAAAEATAAAKFTADSTAFSNDAATFTQNQTDFNTKKTDLDALKQSPIDDGKVLSDIAFTEKGS